jgi:hypothetical protein
MGAFIFISPSYYYQEQYQSPKFWVGQQIAKKAYALRLSVMCKKEKLVDLRKVEVTYKRGNIY